MARSRVAGGTYTVAGLNRALRKLPAETQRELKDAAQRIAADVAPDIAAAARAVGGVAGRVAPSVKARRGRVPVIAMGGAGRLPSGGRVGDALWGAEFGGGRRPRTRQFLPWRGSGSTAGYFAYPTIRRRSDYIADTYSEALLAALEAI